MPRVGDHRGRELLAGRCCPLSPGQLCFFLKNENFGTVSNAVPKRRLRLRHGREMEAQLGVWHGHGTGLAPPMAFCWRAR